MAAFEELVQLSGYVDPGGAFAFTRADPPQTGSTRGLVPESAYRFEVLNAAAEVIDRRPAAVRPNRACPPTRLRVAATVELTDDARIVRVVESERTLWRQAVAAPPQVNARLVGDVSRESGATLEVSYEAPAEPSYLRVALRRDGSAGDIVVLPTTALAGSLHVDLSWAPGGVGRLVVTIGAGLRSATALTEPFELPPLGVHLALNEPPDRFRTAPGRSLSVSAGVINLDEPDRIAEPPAVDWLVDDHPAASGLHASLPALPAGEHRITVRLQADPKVTRSVTVIIAADDSTTTAD